jgi:formylglycine-generating enzyme required for sulfatase activity
VNSQQNADETPPHVVMLDAFFIDAVEVTNAQFARFAAGSSYQTDAERAGDQVTWRTFNTDDRQRFPVTHVSWTDAARYCAWVGKRLPTEAEWEKAAKGGADTEYSLTAYASELENESDAQQKKSYAEQETFAHFLSEYNNENDAKNEIIKNYRI